jgi:hypothetical protein
VPLCEDDVLGVVVKDELELSYLFVQPAPVAPEDVAVPVVRREDDEVDSACEVGTLRVGTDYGARSDERAIQPRPKRRPNDGTSARGIARTAGSMG